MQHWLDAIGDKSRRASLLTTKAEYSVCWVSRSGTSNLSVVYKCDGTDKKDYVPISDVVRVSFMSE